MKMAKSPNLFKAQSTAKMESERDFQNVLEREMRLQGWNVYSIMRSDLAKATLAGYPDITAWRDDRLIFAELKTDKGRLSTAQEEVLASLENLPSAEVYVWRPRDFDQIRPIIA
jgi:hypothetical protein